MEQKTNTTTNITLQDQVLTNLMLQKTPVTMFLMNGFQMRGVITQFDNFVVMLDIEGRSSMIYKHAISTIQPNYPRPAGNPKKDKPAEE